MGCSNAKAFLPDEQRPGILRNGPPSTNPSTLSIPKSVAFDVPLQDVPRLETTTEIPENESNGDTINTITISDGKPVLPKRLQDRFADKTSLVTVEELEEKHKKAEERRNLQLEERLSKARASMSLPSRSHDQTPPPTAGPSLDRSVSRLGNHDEFTADDERTRSPLEESPTNETPVKQKEQEETAIKVSNNNSSVDHVDHGVSDNGNENENGKEEEPIEAKSDD